MREYQDFKDFIKDIIQRTATKIKNKEAKGKNVEDLKKQKQEFELTLAELNQLENSQQDYILDFYHEPRSYLGGSFGWQVSYKLNRQTYYDVGLIRVNMGNGGKFYGKLAHELKHAFQYENHQISYNYSGIDDFNFHNIAEEVEAYQRTWYFDKEELALEKPDEVDATWVMNKHLQYYASLAKDEEQVKIPPNTLVLMAKSNREVYEEVLKQNLPDDQPIWTYPSGYVLYRGWRQEAGIQ